MMMMMMIFYQKFLAMAGLMMCADDIHLMSGYTTGAHPHLHYYCYVCVFFCGAFSLPLWVKQYIDRCYYILMYIADACLCVCVFMRVHVMSDLKRCDHAFV